MSTPDSKKIATSRLDTFYTKEDHASSPKEYFKEAVKILKNETGSLSLDQFVDVGCGTNEGENTIVELAESIVNEDGNYENLDFRLISTEIQETHGKFRLIIKDVDLICFKKLGIGDSDAWNNLKTIEDLSFRMADIFPDQINVFVELRILDVQNT